MSVSNTTNRVGFAGDGSSAVFSFPYYFFGQADIKVFTYNTVLGSIRQETLNGTFSISGTVNGQGLYTSGANIVYASSPGVTDIVVIFRDPSQVQSYDLAQNGVISSAALVQQLDYITLLVQRLQDEASRSVRLLDGLGSSAFSTTLPSTIAMAPNQLIVVNSNATGFGFASNTGGFGPTGFALIGNGSSQIATYQPFVLSGSSVSGTLTLSNGGTGGLVPQQWGVIFASSASQLATTDAGPAGRVLMSNASSAPSFQLVPLSTAVTGTLPTANGGTGVVGPFTQYGMIYASSATQFATVPSATAGFLLTANGSSPPSFQAFSASSLSGIVSVANGGTGTGSSYIQYGVIFASSATQMASTLAGGNDVPLVGNAGVAPSFKALNLASGSSVTGVLSVANGGLGQGVFAPGTILYASTASRVVSLPMGTSGQFLRSNGSSAPDWAGVLANPMTTSGDIIVGSGAGNASRMAVGADGLVLTSNSSAVSGLLWDTQGQPPGAVIMFAGSSAPTGWLLCNGAAVNRSTFDRLFNVIGTTYGIGDGSTTFNVPNTQGIYVKGAGTQTNSSVVYAGTRGVFEQDKFQGHKHSMAYNFVTWAGSDGANPGGSSSGSVKLDTNSQCTNPISDGTNGTPRTGTTTQPASIVLTYIIKT